MAILMNDPMNPFNEEDHYYTYVDEYGNEFYSEEEYDEFWGGIKKGFKKLKKIAHPKRVIRYVTAPVRLASKVVTAPLKLASKVVTAPIKLISKISSRPPRPMQVRYANKRPIGNISRVNAALNKPIPSFSYPKPKMMLPPTNSLVKMKNVQPTKQAGLLSGNNKMIGLVVVLVVGGLVFYKMKPKGATAK